MKRELARLAIVAVFLGVDVLRLLDRRLARSTDRHPLWVSPW